MDGGDPDSAHGGVSLPTGPFALTTTLGMYTFTACGTYIEVMCAYERFIAVVVAALSAGKEATAALAMVAATRGGNQH